MTKKILMQDPSSSSSSSSSALCLSKSDAIEMPHDNEFDQQTAKRLLQHCGTLIIENFPAGSEFGIDLSIHYAGERFMGVKMIPPGLHFVYFSLVRASDRAVAPRSGFFHHFAPGSIRIAKWDPAAEDITFEINEEQAERISAAFKAGQFDSRLGAYQFDKYREWVSLTDFISADLFDRLNPQCGRLYSASTLVYKPNDDGSTTIGKLDDRGLPDMIVAPEAEIRYRYRAPSKFRYPPNATPAEITANSLDSTYTLETLLGAADPNAEFDLLGEMQFAFTAFMIGHVYDAFEHWRDMMRVVTHAQRALQTRTTLFLRFIRVAHFQLKQTKYSSFADIVENENPIYKNLYTFVINIRNVCSQTTSIPTNDSIAELGKRGNSFAIALTRRFGWDFTDSPPDDELPIVLVDDELCA